MKKHRLMFLAVASAIMLSSCTNTYYVTSRSTFDSTVNEIKTELAKQGYAPSGSSTDTKNNVYVEGTSYSRYTGYGSKMANDFVTTDTYRFTHDDGSTMSFSVSYKAMQDVSKGLVYVTEVSTSGCETSNAKKYDSLCGSNSPVNKINTMSQDASIQKIDVLATTLLVTGLSLLGTILIYAAIL